jgi:prevent-host-death family protein
MKQVSVTELTNKLSQYLRLVKSGEIIEILEHSVPVARLQGLDETTVGDAQIERLVRDGLIARPALKPSKALIKQAPIPCRGDVVAAVIEERGDR